jgi:hypothetical protein
MTPLRIIGILLGAVALLLLTVLTVGFLLPSQWQAERDAWIEASADSIFPFLNQAEQWSRWTPSPASGMELFGPPAGPGSGRRWDDPGYGSGEFVIQDEQAPDWVTYVVSVEGGAIRIEGRLTLTPDGNGTRVSWTEAGDFGWNPLLGFLTRRMGELQGDQLEASLSFLRALVEEGVPIQP